MNTETLLLSRCAVEVCCVCGTPFAVPRVVQQQRQEDHELFYCPDGHALRYVDSVETQQWRREAS